MNPSIVDILRSIFSRFGKSTGKLKADPKPSFDEAWEFFHFCNAVHTANLEANPPRKKIRIERDLSGLWSVRRYEGIRVRPPVVPAGGWGGFMGPPQPFPVPNNYRFWNKIGHFRTRREAREFVRKIGTASSAES